MVTGTVREARRRAARLLAAVALALLGALGGAGVGAAQEQAPVVKPAPSVVVTEGPAEGARTGPSVTFAFTAPAGATVGCTVDGVALASCASPLALGPLPEGTHTLTLQADDGTPGATRTWVVDTTSPTVAVGVDPAAPTTTTAFTFTADEPLAPTLECSVALLGGARAAPKPDRCGADGASFPALGEGTHVLTVTGTDLAGNLFTATRRWTRPVAAFTAPATALVGDAVPLTSISSDAEGDLARQEWGLGGAFDAAAGPAFAPLFAAPGPVEVGLRVTDSDGVQATAFRTVVIAERPAATPPATSGPPATIPVTPAPLPATPRPSARPALLSPFPVVRIAGQVFRSSTRIRLLTVLAPRGARLELRCRGRRCPFRVLRQTAPGSGRGSTVLLRVRRVEGRRLLTGHVLEVRVTRPGAIGKLTRFRIRGGGRVPVRQDRCLLPGSGRAVACPS